jgi:hypothetical protein
MKVDPLIVSPYFYLDVVEQVAQYSRECRHVRLVPEIARASYLALLWQIA